MYICFAGRSPGKTSLNETCLPDQAVRNPKPNFRLGAIKSPEIGGFSFTLW